MKYIAVFVLLFLDMTAGHAQTSRDLLLGVAFDLFKTDQISVASKVQAGAEVNYFIVRNISATGGIEIWTGTRDNSSLILGMRWYPVEPVFIGSEVWSDKEIWG